MRVLLQKSCAYVSIPPNAAHHRAVARTRGFIALTCPAPSPVHAMVRRLISDAPFHSIQTMNAATITFAPVCSSLGLLKSKALPGNPATTKTPAEQPAATNKGGCFL
jgi:hypothetical protein